jgi:hypothetical protein
MMRLRTLFVFVLLVAGCAPTRETHLSEIVPYRSYKAEREDVKTALRVFCEREEFVVHLSEATFGRMLGSHVDQGSSNEDPRTIIMTIILEPAGTGMTKVDARFALGNVQRTLVRSDEDALVDYYHRLFDFLDGYFQTGT